MAGQSPVTAEGVTLSPEQSKVVSCVLGLFAGEASPDKLKMWADDAVFEDQLTIATGRKQYEAQWYGLKTICSNIDIEFHKVLSAGNPIEMELRTKYVLKGIGTEQKISSHVGIFTNPDGSVSKVQDKWNGKLPDNAFTNALRKLNANVVPMAVNVPKE